MARTGKASLLVMMTMLVMAATCGALTIEMRDAAEASTSYVRLSDVASMPDATDDERARLGGLFLGRAPRDGQESVIRRDDVLMELKKQGVATDRVKFTGAEETRVVAGVAAGETPERAFSVKLVRAVQLFLRRQPAFQGTEAQIEVVGPVDVPQGTGAITEVVPDQTPGPGVGWWEATWRPEGEGTDVRIPFQARIAAYLTVVVARRALSANASLNPDDVELARVSADAGREYYTTVSDVLGLKLSRVVAKGTPIDPSCLKAVVLVKARDTVLVRVEGSGYAIEFYAEAQQDGGTGEVVRAKNLTSGRVFVGRVIGRGRIEPVGVGEGGNR
ncbi:MAG: flagellar basal body P-ring formation chaperone FlgA [Planctomycetota bacterium]